VLASLLAVCSSISVAEFWDDVRIAIPAIAEYLKDSHSDVLKAAIEGVSRLAVQGI